MKLNTTRLKKDILAAIRTDQPELVSYYIRSVLPQHRVEAQAIARTAYWDEGRRIHNASLLLGLSS